MKRLLLPVIIVILALSGCTASSFTDSFFAMDTYMSITVNGRNAEAEVKKSKELIEKLDKTLSAHDKNSEVFKLNKNRKIKLSPDALSTLKSALKYNKLTEGAFNPAMLSVSGLWGFSDKKHRVPEENEIKKALKSARPDKIEINSNFVSFNIKGTKIDLGGIAKGFASQKVIDALKKDGIDSAIINLGGNVQTLGTKPDGSLWTVAVESPDKTGCLGQLKLKDKAIVTSGGYERYFKKNGKIYHHILNPENGYPAESGLKSVTIISENGAQADALSTALFVTGEKKAVAYWRKHKDFDFIIYTDKNELKISESIANSFNSELQYEVIV